MGGEEGGHPGAVAGVVAVDVGVAGGVAATDAEEREDTGEAGLLLRLKAKEEKGDGIEELAATAAGRRWGRGLAQDGRADNGATKGRAFFEIFVLFTMFDPNGASIFGERNFLSN